MNPFCSATAKAGSSEDLIVDVNPFCSPTASAGSSKLSVFECRCESFFAPRTPVPVVLRIMGVCGQEWCMLRTASILSAFLA